MSNFQDLLAKSYWDNSVQEYLIAALIFVGIVVVLKIIKSIIRHKLLDLAKKTNNDLDDFVIKAANKITFPFYVVVSGYTVTRYLEVTDTVSSVASYITLVVVIWYGIKVIMQAIDYISLKIAKRAQEEEKTAVDASFVQLISKIMKGIVWVIAIIFILSNLGFNVASLLTGVGVGGIAIAFALQSILEDIFASFSIYFDKPFRVGDFIIVGDDMGVVKKIGIKTTRIQTLQGEELVISNTELTETRIHNFKKMEERRISFGIGITYETPNEKLKKIPDIVKGIVEDQDKTRFDRTHFKEFSDSSLDYEIVYYLDSADYNEYMDVQQEINLGIKEALEKEGIEMAYPTRTLYMTNSGDST